jgi:hypothetical protein
MPKRSSLLAFRTQKITIVFADHVKRHGHRGNHKDLRDPSPWHTVACAGNRGCDSGTLTSVAGFRRCDFRTLPVDPT